MAVNLLGNSEEFDLRPGGIDRKTRIAFPTDALYCESISIYKDYAEAEGTIPSAHS